MMLSSFGEVSCHGFWLSEYSTLNLRDKRLNDRAKKILLSLSQSLTSCVRRFTGVAKDARQAYDFF